MRDTFVDRLKGYACFLVVFGHVIMGIRIAGVEVPSFFYVLEKFIWSFHVALFLFLSGYVYQITGGWRSKETKWNFIKYKLINLGIPYLIFSVIYILINSFISSANTQFSAADILWLWKSPVAQYWFLYALFFLFCIWTALADVLKDRQIAILMILVGYAAPMFGISFGPFEVVMYSALAFGAGTFVKLSYLKKGNIFVKLFVITGHVLAGVLLAHFDMLGYPIIKETMMLLGIYASILFISLLEQYRPVDFFLEFVNRYSFQIYLLHTIFTAGIRIVLIRMNVTQWFIHVICGCIFGIGLSAVLAYAAKRILFFNLCFFPTKTFRELANKKRSKQ